MTDWRAHTENWLSSEALGHEAAADRALSQLLSALPAVEPSTDFVHRTVLAAWRTRIHQRRAIARAAAAASLMAVAAAGVAAYSLSGGPSGWPMTTAAAVIAGSIVSLLMAAAASVEWWAAMAHVGDLTMAVVTVPQNAAALLGLGLAGVAALSGLHRLLRTGVDLRDPGPLCL